MADQHRTTGVADRMQRRLAAILSIDAKDYSLKMASDEDGTHRRMRACIEAIKHLLRGYDGRVFTEAGDGLLVEFNSATHAVRCAVSIQQQLAEANRAVADHERIEFRVGVNVGDVLVHGGAVGGDSVNIAARLEQVAEPGGVCVSRAVFEQVRRVVPFRFEELGMVVLKNITDPVQVYRLLVPADMAAADTIAVRPTGPGILGIAVLGGMAAQVDGRPVRLRSRKARAALAYLALLEPQRETRERLVGLLWSEVEEAKARASLRQILHELREVLEEVGFRGLTASRFGLELNPACVVVDAGALVAEAEAHRAHRLLLDGVRPADSLLHGFDDLDPAFEVWVRARRQGLQDALLRHLDEGMHDSGVAPRERRNLAVAIMNLDPTNEETCRWLMRARAQEGDTVGALRAYDALWRVLSDDYDMEPSEATQLLVADIKMGRLEPGPTAMPILAAPASGVPARPNSTRIALLVDAFAVNGIDPDKTHMVDGFRLDLIASLVRFREWYVIESAGPSAGKAPPDLTRYQITAVAYQSATALSLVLALRELDGNVYVWSERLELRLANWFETQQRIVRRVAMSLNVQLSVERMARLAYQPDVSLTVLDKWLRGQALADQFNPESWDRARQIFAEATVEAPNFSLAHSSLAEINNTEHIVYPGLFRDPEKALATIVIARKAVALDPMDARAQLCLGWSFAMARQYARAATHMDLAYQLNQSNSWTCISTALFHAFYGEFHRARELAQQSLSQTPNPSPAHWAYQVSILYLCGDDEGALDAADRADDVIRTLLAWRAAAEWRLGRTGPARRNAALFLRTIRSCWFGIGPPTDEAVARWLLHLYPISQPAHWESLRAGLDGAGMPTAGLQHQVW